MTTHQDIDAKADVHEMAVIHRVFRRELRLLPELLRAVPAGDTERMRVLTGHAHLILEFLHSHHTGEDENLWPLLLERAAPDGELIRSMQAQHTEVASCVEGATELLDRLEQSADPGLADLLAKQIDRLAGVLASHLDQEERSILPLAERHLSVAEWEKLGEHGRSHTARENLPIVFHAILEEADQAERSALLAKLPTLPRLLLPTLGKRQYRRYIQRVRG